MIEEVVLVKDEEKIEGAFFGEGTAEEYAKFEREEKGLKNIFGLDS